MAATSWVGFIVPLRPVNEACIRERGELPPMVEGIEQDDGWKRNEKATCDSELTIVVSLFSLA